MDWTTSSNEPSSSILHNVQTTQLYQPTITGINERKPLDIELQLDPIIFHNINLMKYIQKLTPFSELLDSKSKQFEISGKSDSLPPLLNTVIEQPPMLKSSENKSPFLSTISNQSALNLPKDKMVLDFKTLEPKSKLKFLQRSILVSCLNEGLIDCDRHILDTLTDLLDHFFTTISTQMACSKLGSRETDGRKSSSVELASLQNILIDSGIGTIPDLLHHGDANFNGRCKILTKNAETVYKECISRQEKMRKMLSLEVVVGSPSSFQNRIASEAFASPMEVGSSRRDGMKRSADSLGPSSEEDVFGFYGHSEYVGSNPAKRMKL